MNPSRDFEPSSANGFSTQVEAAIRNRPNTGSRIGIAFAPGVVDVMGGIGEDAGSLVLTAPTTLGHHTAVWPIAGDKIHIGMVSKTGTESGDATFPASMLASDDTAAICARCDKSPWAAPTLMAIRRMIVDQIAAAPAGGLAILIEHDFPENADLGRLPSQAAAAASAFLQLQNVEAETMAVAQSCANVVAELVDLQQLRKTMTALRTPSARSIWQMRFHPNLLCEALELPQGVIIKAVATRLTRPTTLKRLIETRVCSEMGHRIIQELQRQDGQNLDPAQTRLSSITPAEYVERFRDRMPSKITHQQFTTKFGTVRGLGDGSANPKEVFKIRSRAEHHIYENRRVHDFATHIVRARRATTIEALMAAGELMYASHWSHSQRCGIGGVETDRLVNNIREFGEAAGLYGAKVTAGGEGGELVVLMRDDEQAHVALAKASAMAEEASNQPVVIFGGVRQSASRSISADAARSPATAGAV